MTAIYVAYGDAKHGMGSFLRAHFSPLAGLQQELGIGELYGELSHSEVRTACAVLMSLGFLLKLVPSIWPSRQPSLQAQDGNRSNMRQTVKSRGGEKRE